MPLQQRQVWLGESVVGAKRRRRRRETASRRDHLPAVSRPLAYHLRLPPALEVDRDLFAYAAPPFLNAVVLRRFDYRGLIALRLQLLVLLLLLLSGSEVWEDLGDARDGAGRASG